MRFTIHKPLHWPTGAEVRQKTLRGGAMLYDASRAGNAEPVWLDRAWWSKRGEVRGTGEGRGSASFIEADGRRLVLRHYRRGGAIRHLLADRYLWQGATATRSFVEWHLLYLMRRAGLPVPVPIAAAYRRVGRFSYTADLLTELIPDAQSLASRVVSAPVSILSWVALGRTLRRFHDDGVFHADLNAHNVLLGEAEQVWLIDFDRGMLRRPGFWCDANLVRLRRSLEKLTQDLPDDHFSDADWASLLSGYLAPAQPAELAF